MSSEKGGKKDKNQNIQVFLRLRPLNQRERDIKSLGVVEVVHNREVVVRQSQQTQHTKKFTFDHAFGPDAKQVEIYQHVVSPLIEEVLAGYNCTVFAYGQTGTGKTHTMVGENTGDESTWQTDPLAGIIPRALSQLFDELRLSNTEYTVRVSYLELYNEELFDLLSSSEDNSKLRIYEDMTRKGSNIVHGLEEVTVYNKNEVYRIMAQGQERKRVASTLMNAQSSRSHTVFTILVHMKENSPEGEELVKIGKLNLVDLAGSENISKAGSDNPAKRERARECVNINQSLLTLGRVITALVERHPHIPYRESKLTRILQESLGGRTKTSIIATISPGHKDLEETMSTLEYAHRAKNIQNKPEVNQKMTKKAILKEYSEEIDRLKKDLQAARDKNGVYLANETFAEMNFKQEEQRKEIQELLLKKRAMEEERDKMEYVFTDLNKALEMRDTELNVTKDILSSTKMELNKTNNVLLSTKQQLEEQSHLVSVHHTTETSLLQQAKQIISAADTAADHATKLHDTVDRFRGVESGNLQITRTYREQSKRGRDTMLQDIQQFASSLVDTLNSLHSNLENISATNNLTLEESRTKLDELVQKLTATMDEIKSLTNDTHNTVTTNISSYNNNISSRVAVHRTALQQNMSSLLHHITEAVGHARNCTLTRDLDTFVQQWYSEGAARISSLQKCQQTFNARISQLESKRVEQSRKHRDGRRLAVAHRTACVKDTSHKIEADVTQIQQNLKEHLTLLSSLHKEREATEDRLNKWAEDERTAFRSKIQEERRLFELKIQEEKRMFEEKLQTRLCHEKEAIKQQIAAKITELESSYSQVSTFLQHSASLQQHTERTSSADLEQLQEEQEHDDGASADLTRGLGDYGREFDDECHAIKAEMEALTTSVIQIVEPLYNAVVHMFVNTNDTVQKDSEALIEQDNANSNQLLNECAAAFDSILNKYKDSTTSVINTVESTATNTISTLQTISSTNATIASTSQSHCNAHNNTVQDIQKTVRSLNDNMKDNMTKLLEIETKYLSDEYRVYSPSGATPVRTRYVYPQKLVATSPHERILARFRAARANNVDDDECVIVDSDTESRTISDSESSLSESSVFVAPSPLPPPINNGPLQPSSRHGIVKCTSESDIYTIKRNEDNHPGKENTRSVSKRSKLPAPSHSSHKKPLVERNAD